MYQYKLPSIVRARFEAFRTLPSRRRAFCSESSRSRRVEVTGRRSIAPLGPCPGTFSGNPAETQ